MTPIALDMLHDIVAPLGKRHLLRLVDPLMPATLSNPDDTYVLAHRVKTAIRELTGISQWAPSPLVPSSRCAPKPGLRAGLDSTEGVLFVWDGGGLRLREKVTGWRYAVTRTHRNKRETIYRSVSLDHIVDLPVS